MSFGSGPIKVVEKLWGLEEWYHNGDSCLKVMRLKSGFSSSLHYHKVKSETFLVLEGDCWVELNYQQKHLFPGDWVHILPFDEHRFWNDSGKECVFIEGSTTHSDSDTYRITQSRALDEHDINAV